MRHGAAASRDIKPQLLFRPDALASYDRAARTIALMREEGAGHFALVGNEAYRNFGE